LKKKHWFEKLKDLKLQKSITRESEEKNSNCVKEITKKKRAQTEAERPNRRSLTCPK
jgi:hypothetical protein